MIEGASGQHLTGKVRREKIIIPGRLNIFYAITSPFLQAAEGVPAAASDRHPHPGAAVRLPARDAGQ